MPIRTSKSKIYRKIKAINNIHRQIQFLMAHSMQKNNLPCPCQSNISYITINRFRFKLESFYYRGIPPLTYKHIENSLTKKGGDRF